MLNVGGSDKVRCHLFQGFQIRQKIGRVLFRQRVEQSFRHHADFGEARAANVVLGNAAILGVRLAKHDCDLLFAQNPPAVLSAVARLRRQRRITVAALGTPNDDQFSYLDEHPEVIAEVEGRIRGAMGDGQPVPVAIGLHEPDEDEE